MIDGFQQRHGLSDAAVIPSPLSRRGRTGNYWNKSRTADADARSKLSDISRDMTGLKFNFKAASLVTIITQF